MEGTHEQHERLNHDPEPRIYAARSDHVVGFNPLKSRHTELAVDGVLHVFHQLYADSWGPRTQDILHSTHTAGAGDRRRPPDRPRPLRRLDPEQGDRGHH